MWRLLKREDDNYGVQDDIDKPLCWEFLTLRQTLDRNIYLYSSTVKFYFI